MSLKRNTKCKYVYATSPSPCCIRFGVHWVKLAMCWWKVLLNNNNNSINTGNYECRNNFYSVFHPPECLPETYDQFRVSHLRRSAHHLMNRIQGIIFQYVQLQCRKNQACEKWVAFILFFVSLLLLLAGLAGCVSFISHWKLKDTNRRRTNDKKELQNFYSLVRGRIDYDVWLLAHANSDSHHASHAPRFDTNSLMRR